MQERKKDILFFLFEVDNDQSKTSLFIFSLYPGEENPSIGEGCHAMFITSLFYLYRHIDGGVQSLCVGVGGNRQNVCQPGGAL